MQELTLRPVLLREHNPSFRLRSTTSPTSPVNTDVMEEDKCYHRRLRVGRVSRLGPLLIWIPRTLRRCMVLQVVKLSELLSSHP